MIAVDTQVTIVPVSFTAILDAPNAADLIHAYASECIVPDAEPQRPLYEAMEKAGAIHCFGAYAYKDSFEMSTVNGCPSLLIGFCSVLCGIMPHDGHLVATISEMFVDPSYRSTGAADLLLGVAEQCATDAGCRCLISLARDGSPYDKMLGRRPGYNRTHAQHTKWLNGYSGGWK